MSLFKMFVSLIVVETMAHGYEPPAPSSEVETVRYEWHDSKRDRDVPAKVYFTKAGSGPQPIVIFSHGLGGSREGYEYLGKHWAGCGYVSVHLQHLGSDDAVWKSAGAGGGMKAMTAASMDIRNALNRPADVSFAIDQLAALDADPASPLRGRLDLQRIAVAGHSFGGYTAMVIAGQALGPTASTRLADSRVQCAIEMSAPVARPAVRKQSYDTVKIPLLHMTGTLDDSPIGDTKAAERRIPFDLMKHADTALINFEGGDHMIFSGRVRAGEGDPKQDAAFQRLICASTTGFLDGFLKGDGTAQTWLFDGGCKNLLGIQATFESKRAGK